MSRSTITVRLLTLLKPFYRQSQLEPITAGILHLWAMAAAVAKNAGRITWAILETPDKRFSPTCAAGPLLKVRIPMFTPDEWFWIAVINALAFMVGAVYTACTFNKQTPLVIHIMIEAPCASAIVQALCLFLFGVISGIRAGRGLGAAFGEGLSTAFIFGIGAALLGIPGAVFGGGVTWAIARALSIA